MKEKLKQILARFVFSLYHKKILKNRISVNSIEETVEHLVKSEDSLVRFGDGEIKLMAGKEIPFQSLHMWRKARASGWSTCCFIAENITGIAA